MFIKIDDTSYVNLATVMTTTLVDLEELGIADEGFQWAFHTIAPDTSYNGVCNVENKDDKRFFENFFRDLDVKFNKFHFGSHNTQMIMSPIFESKLDAHEWFDRNIGVYVIGENKLRQ
jgi:hypothetical protein